MRRPRFEPYEYVSAGVAALLIAYACTLLAGCCTNAAGSATCARKVVTGMYTVVGAATTISRASLKKCEEDAITAKSDAQMAKCATAQDVLSKALPIAAEACGATASSIDAAEAIKAKDYAAALAPLYAAAKDLAQALSIAGVKLPIPIPGVQ